MVELIEGKYENMKSYINKKFDYSYFEFEFAYVPITNTFKEINRYIWESKHQMTRFKNRYSGPVLIDISSWNKNHTNEFFDAFMYYLKDQHYSKLAFTINEPCTPQLKASIKRFFKLNEIELEYEKNSQAIGRIGFSVEDKEKDYVRS